MTNLLQFLKYLTCIIIALVIAFVVWSGPHISACKVEGWGLKAEQVEITTTRQTADKPALTCKPQKHSGRKHP